jgi:hypothetical protein
MYLLMSVFTSYLSLSPIFEVIHPFAMEMEELGEREDTRGLPVYPVYENHRI